MKKVSHTPQGTYQRCHNGVAFCRFIKALDDTAVLFQPAEQALDDTALAVLGGNQTVSFNRAWVCASRSAVGRRAECDTVRSTGALPRRNPCCAANNCNVCEDGHVGLSEC